MDHRRRCSPAQCSGAVGSVREADYSAKPLLRCCCCGLGGLRGRTCLGSVGCRTWATGPVRARNPPKCARRCYVDAVDAARNAHSHARLVVWCWWWSGRRSVEGGASDLPVVRPISFPCPAQRVVVPPFDIEHSLQPAPHRRCARRQIAS